MIKSFFDVDIIEDYLCTLLPKHLENSELGLSATETELVDIFEFFFFGLDPDHDYIEQLLRGNIIKLITSEFVSRTYSKRWKFEPHDMYRVVAFINYVFPKNAWGSDKNYKEWQKNKLARKKLREKTAWGIIKKHALSLDKPSFLL
jgi:hypothetical protein